MSYSSAPLMGELGRGLVKGAAVWLKAADGVKSRAACFVPSTEVVGRGTVLLLPGRTEFIEKYADLILLLTQKGFMVAILDWRGQGLSDRIAPDPRMGHVGRFSDYQMDIDALLAWLKHERITAPHVMFAHSMGGLIGLRSLYRDLGVKAAVFSAPMWGIQMPVWRLPMAAVLSRLKQDLRLDFSYAPTTSPQSYVLTSAFVGNALTSDVMAWEKMQHIYGLDPAFALGGPSLRWVRRGLHEARKLMARPAPDLPIITALGSHEAIVRPDVIHKRMATWQGGRLDLYPKGRHELLWEAPAIRSKFLQRITEHFERFS